MRRKRNFPNPCRKHVIAQRNNLNSLLLPSFKFLRHQGWKKKASLQWMLRLPKGNHVDYWNVKIHPLKAPGAIKSRMSHLRGRIRQPFRGYDGNARNAHFRASRKKEKLETILHHLTFSPSLRACPTSTLRCLDTRPSSAPQWRHILGCGLEFQLHCTPTGPPRILPGFSLTASCISPTRHVPRSWLKLTSPLTHHRSE